MSAILRQAEACRRCDREQLRDAADPEQRRRLHGAPGRNIGPALADIDLQAAVRDHRHADAGKGIAGHHGGSP
jgi:hypothetical protein